MVLTVLYMVVRFCRSLTSWDDRSGEQWVINKKDNKSTKPSYIGVTVAKFCVDLGKSESQLKSNSFSLNFSLRFLA